MSLQRAETFTLDHFMTCLRGVGKTQTSFVLLKYIVIDSCARVPFHIPGYFDLFGRDMESKLGRLSINQDTSKAKKVKPGNKAREIIAESWDDEAESSNSDTDVDHITPSKKSPIPNAPPPTPASPRSAFPSWDSHEQMQFSTRVGDGDNEDRRRPEKSTAVAGRLIAAGLGMRAPKKSEEQTAYDRAAKENERKRRNKEKQAKDKEREENEKAQTGIWES
jgi:hypothetical protein